MTAGRTVAIAVDPARDVVRELRSAGRDLEDAAETGHRLVVGAGRWSNAPARVEEVVTWAERCARELDERIDRIVALDAAPIELRRAAGRARVHLDVRGAQSLDELLSALMAVGALAGCVPHGDPTARYAALAGLSHQLTSLLLDQVPELLAGADGVPFALRDRANRRRLEDELERLADARSELAAALRADLRGHGIDEPRIGSATDLHRQLLSIRGLTGEQWVVWHAQHRRLLELDALARQLADWRDDADLQVLALDVPARRVVLARGDLDAATHVGVLVPGANSTLLTIGSHYTGWMDRLRHVAQQRLELEGDEGRAASVLWLDFDAPQGLIPAAMGNGPAQQAATRLPGFLDGVAAVDRELVTTLGHSYGSVVVGRSLADHPGELATDQIVALGSPGMGVQTSGALGLREEQRLYASTLSGDPIAAVGRWNPVTGDLGRVVHGPDPRRLSVAHPVEVPVHDLPEEGSHLERAADRHMQYLEPGSVALGTFADLVAGRHRDDRRR